MAVIIAITTGIITVIIIGTRNTEKDGTSRRIPTGAKNTTSITKNITNITKKGITMTMTTMMTIKLAKLTVYNIHNRYGS